MSKASLVIMAAGMGSRYGGVKQIAGVGPNGEILMEYAIYDALRAGFDKVVLLVRPDLVDPLKEHFKCLDGKLDIQYAIQTPDKLPAPYTLPEGRTKPWGTGHAILCARDFIDSPFAAINADDFYGAGTFRTLADFLLGSECNPTTYALVAFQLLNTLSENGTVSRGICEDDGHGYLKTVVERTSIEGTPDGAARFKDDDGTWKPLTGKEPASMNFWGFHPSIFPELERLFTEFLAAHGQEMKSEFYIPFAVDSLIKAGRCKARMLTTDERWFGMTYSEDRQLVVDKVRELTQAGIYPEKLWN